MAFVVSGLTDYVEQNRRPILRNVGLGVKTAEYVSKMANVKNITNLNLVDVQAIIKDRACGWNPSGDTTFSERPLKVRRAEVEQEYCLEALSTKWMNEELITKATNDKELDSYSFGEEIISGLIEDANRQIEIALWQATSGGADGFDGYLAVAQSVSATTKVATTTADTIYSKTVKVYLALPDKVRAKAHIFMSMANFDALVQELITKGLYHPDFNAVRNDGEYTINLPGYAAKIHGVPGLENSNVVFAADPKNLFYGFDIEGDSESILAEHKKLERKWCLMIAFNYGSQIAFPDMVRYAV